MAPEVICKELLTSQAFKYFADSIKRFGGSCWVLGCVLVFFIVFIYFFPESLLNTNKKVFIHFH